MLQAECQTLIYDHPGIGKACVLVVISIEDHADDLLRFSQDADAQIVM